MVIIVYPCLWLFILAKCQIQTGGGYHEDMVNSSRAYSKNVSIHTEPGVRVRINMFLYGYWSGSRCFFMLTDPGSFLAYLN